MSKGTILVVDDEQEICDMLSRAFRMQGYVMHTANNGADALKLMSELAVDVVISDIIMPKMDGVELLKQIREQYPMTRVIMITGYVSLENALACMRKQAETCVFKPLEDLSELESAVVDAFHSLDRWKRKIKELQGLKQ